MQGLEDPKVHFIYRIDRSIYGVPDEEKYLFITDEDYTQEVGDNNLRVVVSDWFKMIENCELLPWKAACLKGPKNIIKEAVKLLMSTDIVKLYDNIIKRYPSKEAAMEELWDYYNDVKLTNQIIDNHKIANFKCSANEWNKITSYETFLALIEPHMKELRDKGQAQSEYAAKKRLEAKINSITKDKCKKPIK